MKKKILLFFFVLVASRIFAGGYIYWEDHKTLHSGQITLHIKICCPKGYMNDAIANEIIQELVDMYRGDEHQKNLYGYFATFNITQVYLSDGEIYKIVLLTLSSNLGGVVVGKTNINTYGPMEKIYEIKGFSYNYLYDIYQTQCNKYLNML